ncbi:ABC transporter permease [Humibacillus xanthopallidus]|uniref:Iron(III) transport system permease protein n=1 Tax=Humibacillus xanthopallidus TaxID=412689 RepID=A0A543HWM4_9MICO|nr:iron ABC transporter permease [Humibacillus xanthopallidus]TQM62768.1 iron(III) transport system permease protein [Humibacillus xanthopallidus]
MAGALLALLPLGYLVVRTVEAGDRVGAILARPGTLELVGRSLALVGTVTTLCLVLGVGLAALVTRTTLPGRRLFAVLLALPLAVPSYVAAFAWVAAAPWARGFVGATLVLTACTYPYVFLPVVAAMRGVDPAQEEVARSLGRGPGRTFLTVTVRQVWPAAASGGLLVALYVLSDFGAVSLLQFDAFTRVIHTSYRASFDRTPAAVLSLLLVVLTVLIALGERRSRGGLEQTRVGSGLSRRSEPLQLGRLAASGATAAVVAVVGVALAFPLASLVYWFVTGLSAGVDVDRLVTSTGTTLLLALLGALVTMAIAVPIGVLAARHRSRATSAIELGAWAGHALPGIVVALALVFFGVRVAQPIYQRTPLLLIAYAVLFLPAGVGAVRASVAMSSPRVEEVARSLGSRPLDVLRRVTLPLAGPGVAAGTALVLLTIMKELPATLLLRPTGSNTLATSLWTETGVAAYAAAAPYALALVALAVAPTLWLMHAQGRLGESIEPAESAESAGLEGPAESAGLLAPVRPPRSHTATPSLANVVEPQSDPQRRSVL